MEYAQEVLARLAKIEGRQGRRLIFLETVTCGHCRGTGFDPKYGEPGRCPVCAAAGRVKVKPPVVTCLECGGTGCARGDLRCLACNGVGVVSVRPGAGPCPRCRGTGKTGVFYCNHCKGQGII